MCTYKKYLMASMMALALSSGFALKAEAGCVINYTLHNSSENRIDVSDFKVMSWGGTWKEVQKFPYGFSKGAKYQGTYRAAFSCKAKRRFRFEVSKTNCHKYIYYPSATGWFRADNNNIDFGDVSRHCK